MPIGFADFLKNPLFYSASWCAIHLDTESASVMKAPEVLLKTLFLLFIFATSSIISLAQGPESLPGVEKKPADTPKPPPPPRTQKQPSVGTINIAASPLAQITISPLKGRQAKRTKDIPANDDKITFSNLMPGDYQVVAKLEGFKPAEKTIRIKAGEYKFEMLTLRPITYPVTIVAKNVSSGELRYGMDGDGIGNIIRIVNGRAELKALMPGSYQIEIRPDDSTYPPKVETITIAEGKTRFEFTLTPRMSDKTLLESWLSSSSWTLPTNWRMESRKLMVNGEGLALPTNEDYRYYRDVDILSNIKILKGGASFVIHAQDPKNYYQFQIITGENNSPVFRALVVKDGRERNLISPLPIDTTINDLRNRFLEVQIQIRIDHKGKTNRFCFRLINSEDANDLFLGSVEDTSMALMIGAPGVMAGAGDQFEVEMFQVRPSQASTNCASGKN